MIDREEIWRVADRYNKKRIAVGSIGSHSALDILDGAKDEEFSTYAWCEKGREEPYTRFFKSQYIRGKHVKGCVDNTIILDKFSQMLQQQDYMTQNSIVIVPNRAFTVYVGETEIEEQFKVPLLGSRNMLRIEERGKRGEVDIGKISDYYSLCEAAGIATPKKLENPDDIDKYGLVMVKLKHKEMHLERGFFTASSRKEFDEKANRLLSRDVITKEDLDKARIEQYILGPVMNFDFFYSPVSAKLGEEPLELLGIDWRFESNLDGLVRLPAAQQLEINEKMRDPLYVVVGHNSCTVRESILRFVFEMGEKFQKATQQYMAPGMIGAYCLQAIITPEMKPVVYDVAFRIGGGTNVHGWVGHNYGNLLWRQRMSSGRRTALELRRAIENNMLHEILT